MKKSRPGLSLRRWQRNGRRSSRVAPFGNKQDEHSCCIRSERRMHYNSLLRWYGVGGKRWGITLSVSISASEKQLDARGLPCCHLFLDRPELSLGNESKVLLEQLLILFFSFHMNLFRSPSPRILSRRSVKMFRPVSVGIV